MQTEYRRDYQREYRDYRQAHPLRDPKSHPTPHFCIFRPGGTLTPLIPVDELPSWLQILNWNPGMYMGLQPASLSCIPREGEYDVICNHCSSSIDSQHQSASETGDSPQSAGSHGKCCHAALFNQEVGNELPELDPKLAFNPSALHISPGQPPSATLHNAFGDGVTINFPSIPGLSFVPMPVLSQIRSNSVNYSSSGSRSRSDSAPKEPPKAPVLHAQKMGFDGTHGNIDDKDDSSSILNLPPLPPPAIPLNGQDRPTMHPLSPDTQTKISQAIAASLCSVSVENENCPPQCDRACQRRASIASNSIASSLCPAAVPNEKVEPPVSLTVAIERFKDVLSQQEPSQPASPLSQTSSRTKRRRSAAQRRQERASRRRERRKEKLERMAIQSPVAEKQSRFDEALSTVRPKPEQVNSSTKRRDRRERQMKRGKKDSSSQSRYVHMGMASNSRCKY